MALHTVAHCDEIAPLLGAFQDGELRPHLMKDVARHLASCKDCENAFDGYSVVGQMLRDASPEPNLDGFAMAVQARIARLRSPLRLWLGRWFDSQRERFGSAPAMALAMSAAALLAFVIAAPFARNMIGAGRSRAVQVAKADVNAIAREATKAPAALAAAVNGKPGVIISKLETSNPDVAVWSEPSQGTTVIWLADQQH